MQVDPPGPAGQDSDYRDRAREAREQESDYRARAREAREQELSQLRARIKKNKEAGQAEREKVNEQLKAWAAVVDMRDQRRRNVGLMLAGFGLLVGILLLFWASRLQLGSFPEKILDGLGTAMLVAATVEVAARLIRNLISIHQGKVEENRDEYLQRIRDDVIAIATDLNQESIKREAAELDARDANDAERKALWEDVRDEIMALPSRSPEQERILQSLENRLEALPVPDSYYYSAKADLQFNKRIEERWRRLEGMEERRRRLESGKPDQGGKPDENLGLKD